MLEKCRVCNTDECQGCLSAKRTGWALLFLRLAAGVIFAMHGYDKLFTETPGIDGFAGYLTSLSVPAPVFFAWLVALIEFVGGILIIAGVLVSFFGLLLAINMAFAFFLTKGGLPEGELDLALFAIVLALSLAGSGKFAILPTRVYRKKLKQSSDVS